MAIAARIFFFFATLGVLLFAGGEAFADKRVALVIGNSSYAHAPALDNPVNDATAVSVMLKSAGFQVVETRNNLDLAAMGRVIRDFATMTYDADVAVVFYAGHGIEVDGVNYLIPTDAKLATDIDVEYEAMPLDRVLRVLEPARSLRLVMLDACRDNPFVRTMKRTMASRAVGRGLAGVEPTGSNTLIAFAAKAGSTAQDGEGAHSPFTSALLKHLIAPGLDLRIAFGKVRDEVLAVTGARQEPHVYGSLGGTTIALVPAETSLGAAAGAAPSPAAAGGLTNEIGRDYELAMRVGTREALDAFLATHPSGFYADLARAQRTKLLAAVPPTAPATAPAPAAAPVPAVAPPQAEPAKRGKARATRDTDPPAARAKQKPAREAAPSAANRTRSSSSSGCGYVRRAVSAGTAAGLDNGVGLIAFARRNCGG
jgi:caspase domain-containing protein